jgi:hypothetical protein
MLPHHRLAGSPEGFAGARFPNSRGC